MKYLTRCAHVNCASVIDLRMMIREDIGSVVEVIVIFNSDKWIPHFASVNPLIQEILFEIRNTFEAKRTFLIN